MNDTSKLNPANHSAIERLSQEEKNENHIPKNNKIQDMPF